MFNEIKRKFALWREQRALKRHLGLCEKFWQLAGATVQFYKDTSTGVDINPYIRANQELKDKIKTEQDLIYWHKKLVKSGLGFHYQRRSRCY